jgi:release factor glutamine methyltransferase
VTETPFSGIHLLGAPGEVMVPRPATERLVDVAAARLSDRAARVADVGTGSGAIAVALALRAPGARIWATDTSRAAVRLARANVSRHGLDDRVDVLHADLLDGVPGDLDLVVANLPYLSDSLRAERPELASDPPEAVFAPGDGLGHYRRLLAACGSALHPGGAVAIQFHRRVIVTEASELRELGFAASFEPWPAGPQSTTSRACTAASASAPRSWHPAASRPGSSARIAGSSCRSSAPPARATTTS